VSFVSTKPKRSKQIIRSHPGLASRCSSFDES
jgi:hypothetical protein